MRWWWTLIIPILLWWKMLYNRLEWRLMPDGKCTLMSRSLTRLLTSDSILLILTIHFIYKPLGAFYQ